MTAEKMFKDLHFFKSFIDDSLDFAYTKYDSINNKITASYTIIFDLEKKCFKGLQMTKESNFLMVPLEINEKIHEAIIQQINELGWIKK